MLRDYMQDLVVGSIPGPPTPQLRFHPPIKGVLFVFVSNDSHPLLGYRHIPVRLRDGPPLQLHPVSGRERLGRLRVERQGQVFHRRCDERRWENQPEGGFGRAAEARAFADFATPETSATFFTALATGNCTGRL